VAFRQEDVWQGTVRMPLPTQIEQIDLPADGEMIRAPLVRMPGIAHLIIPAGIGLTEESLRRWLPEWNRLIGADALGALLWNAPSRFINPIVYVPSAGTLVREHGCGSGTAAVGSWLAAAAGKTVEMPVHQPGGTIQVTAAILNRRLTALSITGRVKLVDEGEVDIPE
jgi:diaminopimelate epimerase